MNYKGCQPMTIVPLGNCCIYPPLIFFGRWLGVPFSSFHSHQMALSVMLFLPVRYLTWLDLYQRPEIVSKATNRLSRPWGAHWCLFNVWKGISLGAVALQTKIFPTFTNFGSLTWPWKVPNWPRVIKLGILESFYDEQHAGFVLRF